MKMRSLHKYYTTLLLSFMLTFASISVMVVDSSAKDGSDAAVIQSITVNSDGTSVAIVADKPVTYTYYKVADQLKAVIDLSQAEPGNIGTVQELNVGNVKRIEVTKHSFGAGNLTRIEIVMAKDSEFTINADENDKKKLLFTFNQSSQGENQAKPVTDNAAAAPVQAEPVATTQPAAAEPLAVAKTPEPAPVAESAPVEAPVAENKPVAETAGNSDKPVTTAGEKPVESKAVETQASGGKVLTGIAVVGDGVEIQVTGGVESYNSFTLNKPERLVIDIVNATNNIPAKSVPINSFGLAKARVGTNQNKVRIVLDAAKDKLPAYQVATSASGLKVTFSDAAADSAAVEKTAPARTVETPKKVAATQTAPIGKPKSGLLEGIEFKKTDGESQIVMKLSGDCSYAKPTKSGDGLLLVLKNCQVQKKYQRVLDTSSFASAVLSVTPYQVRGKRGADARILVKLQSEAENRLQRDGDTLIWSFKNPETAEPALLSEVSKAAPAAVKKENGNNNGEAEISFANRASSASTDLVAKKKYAGRKISLDFSDADVRQIFRLLEDVSQMNFLIPDEVSGKLTIKLVNVPWDQALDVILETKGLDMRQEGNIIQILPKDKKAKLDQDVIDQKKRAEDKLELVTVVFDVNYSTPDDISKQFNAIKSNSGRITTDTRTNKIIVNDNETRIKDMKELMAKLDIPEKQVMIEARIVEASSSFTRDLGVQWGLHYNTPGVTNYSVDTGLGGIVTPPPATGFQSSGSAGGSMGLSFGKLAPDLKLDLRLSAAQTNGLIKIVSTPKVVTLNNKAAKIAQGQSIPYQTTSAEGTKTEFIEAALTLEVTPHITSDGSVSMKIKATNNTAGTGSPPPINKKEATTELQVKNGETTVIGGIYVDGDTEENKGVPFLSDIPLIGWLFKSNTKSKTKTELLIFITPKILG